MKRQLQVSLLFVLSLSASFSVARELEMSPEQAAGLGLSSPTESGTAADIHIIRNSTSETDTIDEVTEAPDLSETSTIHESTAEFTDIVEMPKASVKALNNNDNVPQFGEQYGPVNNETLWTIAKKMVKNSQFSIHQGVKAITAKNQQAFRNGSINHLKNGVILSMPTKEEMNNT